jgi:hypothetical protein
MTEVIGFRLQKDITMNDCGTCGASPVGVPYCRVCGSIGKVKKPNFYAEPIIIGTLILLGVFMVKMASETQTVHHTEAPAPSVQIPVSTAEGLVAHCGKGDPDKTLKSGTALKRSITYRNANVTAIFAGSKKKQGAIQWQPPTFTTYKLKKQIDPAELASKLPCAMVSQP